MTEKCPLCEIRKNALRELNNFLEWVATQSEYQTLYKKIPKDLYERK